MISCLHKQDLHAFPTRRSSDLGKIMMVKDCPIHGHFEDVMSIDTAFSQHLEEVFPGRDIKAHNDEKLHHHGSSTVKYGRGSDRKSTRLNSSHTVISYAVFCLKK